MAITYGIEDNEVLGPPYREGKREGREEGRRRGKRRKGTKKVVRRLIEQRFGALPAWAEEQLNGSSQTETEDLALRILDAHSLEELLDERA